MKIWIKHIFFLLLASIFLPFISGANEKRIVKYNFPVWEDVSELNGSGLYIELLEIVFAAAGYKAVRFPNEDVPWKKSIRNVILGKSATAGAEYKKLIRRRGMIHPKAPLIIQTIYSIYRRDVFPDGFTLNKCEGKRVVEMLGYELSYVLGLNKIQLSQAPDENSIARMLLGNRIDLALLEGYYLDLARKKYVSLNSDMFGIIEQVKQPLFLMFADTKEGRDNAAVWDRGLKNLISKGQIHLVNDLYKKYNLSNLRPDFDQYLK